MDILLNRHKKEIRKVFLYLLYFLIFYISCSVISVQAQQSNNVNSDNKQNAVLQKEGHKAILLEVNGAITPATQDYIVRGIEYANKQQSELVILQLNTPGGLDSAMRRINQAILTSNVPIATYVAPRGARAASAGTYILYASHIAAMAPGTNLGAASPVQIGGGMGGGFGGEEESKENKDSNTQGETRKKNQKELSTSELKSMKDAAAYMRSLAELRNRNIEWGEKTVLEAVSLSANEAKKLNMIDLIANSVSDLLNTLDGRLIKMVDKELKLNTKDMQIDIFPKDWRFDFLSIITDPSVAYILLLLGIYGLFFEFSNPGFVLPGIAGGIALLLALYSFQLLPINYAGAALLLLGIACIIAEFYISSFGVLGIGGIIAFVLGSVLLLDTESAEFKIAWQLILIMTIITGAFFLVMVNLAIQAMKKKSITGQEGLIGQEGEVIELHNKDHGLVQIQGEIWQAYSKTSLKKGQRIRVQGVEGLLLLVVEVEPQSNE